VSLPRGKPQGILRPLAGGTRRSPEPAVAKAMAGRQTPFAPAASHGAPWRRRVDTDLPNGFAAKGLPVLVTHANGRFSLMTATSLTAETLEVAETPDFTVRGNATHFHYYPAHEIKGTPTFRIQPTASWRAD